MTFWRGWAAFVGAIWLGWAAYLMANNHPYPGVVGFFVTVGVLLVIIALRPKP